MITFHGLQLDPFQEKAIRALDEGRSVLVCAPTGTGKTIIADFVVERALSRGRDVVYTAPIKALSNQKFRDYTRLYGEDRVGLLTGDLVIRREAPCRVMTTEILRNMLLAGEQLPALDAVVIDEIHFLDDRERGTTWEEVLIYLPQHVQIVGLSATLSNVRAFADWLSSVREQTVEVVVHNQRAVPLRFAIANVDDGLASPADFDRAHQRWLRKVHKTAESDDRGPRRGRPRGGGRFHPRRRIGPVTTHGDVFDMLRENDLLPALYFCFSRKLTEQHARGLGARLRRPLLNHAEQEEMRRQLDLFARDNERLLEPALRETYEKGVAFHHAGLHVQLKALVEELYEQRLIKMLYCTSTFALGINMPARAAAFDALKKFDGTQTRPLTTREFMQKAGRAGRRGMDEVGHVVVRMDHDEWDEVRGALDVYLRGDPEPVRSSFSLSFNSVVNLLHRNPPERIREIVEKSFLDWSRRLEADRMVQEAKRREEALEAEGGTRRERRSVDRLYRKATESEGRSWLEFQEKVGFLQRVGYLERDNTFAAGARVLQHVQIEEIFVTELILSGLLEELDDARLFGLLCAVNKEFGRDVRVSGRLVGADLKLAKEANQVRFGPIVTGAEELTGVAVTWCPEMIPFGRMWAEGRPFAELMDLVHAPTDISGDLVGAFRRAKDLCGQLKAVHAEDASRADALGDLIRRVSRDEVMVVD